MFGYRRHHRRTLAYGMFQPEDHGLAAKNARVLERIYHKGQRLAWDGKEVLDALIAEHGPPTMPEETKQALGRVFAIIMWGELAAWRISAELADEIEPLEPKMAATSQAHDEARHFYVMHDYLEALGALPDGIDPGARRVLEGVMNADSLAKKLLGMQLMVEPLALTLFHVVKRLDLEPVLTHLLPYYERDEARHVALGVQYLPALLEGGGLLASLDILQYQFQLITWQLWSSYGVARDVATLGLDPRELVRVGKGKQLAALRQVFHDSPVPVSFPESIFNRYVESVVELTLPDPTGARSLTTRIRRAIQAAVSPIELQEVDVDPGIRDDQVPLIRGLGADDDPREPAMEAV
ncbi:MAG: ferritin-like domain-containing protein [Deltaproteobacteria bacterium]|nr:ferritin-like domain-containing protein [Deltaproteobacteria bacterium]MCB9785693.1 ferritin-like domain-containing protein [Deltaproteobacteria bacterium]